MEALEHELKKLVIRILSLEDTAPEDLDAEDSLFDGGLGLDSVDLLELLAAVRKTYGVTLSSVGTDHAPHLASLRALARFVSSRRQP